MDVSEFLESEYINVELVQQAKQKNAIILNTGSRETTKDYGIKFSLTVMFDGKVKKYHPNKTSIQNIVDVWGLLSDTWMNGVISLSVEDVNGKMVVVARPHKKSVEDGNLHTD